MYQIFQNVSLQGPAPQNRKKNPFLPSNFAVFAVWVKKVEKMYEIVENLSSEGPATQNSKTIFCRQIIFAVRRLPFLPLMILPLWGDLSTCRLPLLPLMILPLWGDLSSPTAKKWRHQFCRNLAVRRLSFLLLVTTNPPKYCGIFRDNYIPFQYFPFSFTFKKLNSKLDSM